MPSVPYKMGAARRRLRYAGNRAILLAIALAVAGSLIAADRCGLFGTRPTPDHEKYDGRTFLAWRVVDGDTLDIDATDEVARRSRTRIRLWGVDTPESVKPNTPVQHYALEASELAKELAEGKAVTIQLERHRTRDKLGRLLAYVILPDGTMLNRELVARGAGYADPRFDHGLKRQFEGLQAKAIQHRLGLWKDARRGDLPDYRDKMKLPAHLTTQPVGS